MILWKLHGKFIYIFMWWQPSMIKIVLDFYVPCMLTHVIVALSFRMRVSVYVDPNISWFLIVWNYILVWTCYTNRHWHHVTSIPTHRGAYAWQGTPSCLVHKWYAMIVFLASLIQYIFIWWSITLDKAYCIG